jgi:hypothetical protein
LRRRRRRRRREGVRYEDHFTLWMSKSRSHGIEWSNFVESLKKWAENSQ